MEQKPKLADVARAANVSTATASQVLRGTGRISEVTRKRVLSAAKKLNYVRDGRAASMRSGENREIGFAVHKISNPFNAEVISGVSDLLETEGYLVSVLDSNDDANRQRRNLEAFIQSSRGGLLWVPAEETDDATYDLLKAHGMPAVTFLRRSGKGRFDHVGIENAAATEKATRYLADLGHRHIAYLGGTAGFGVRVERIEGCRKALSELGLPDLVVWNCPDEKTSGLVEISKLLSAHPEVTGVICNGDMVAIGACSGLTRMGLSPGKDISVVGFDDVQDAAIATPPLTTLAVSPYQLGRKLARVVLERITAPDMPTAVSLVPAELVIRETTGPAPERRRE
ncbi:LacI family DNA-binding transcriptional regulator [Shimia biformata]|uniref:LacI family DNA-binding transcriptional regulator n=1 Tax=Shimia biformata TaxID=1294299 RepID=UPI0019508389|nr:LacI family DNA-binding transcriptional regulator [Shimia biformata]